MHPLGGSMCRPYRSIYPQRQRRLVNRLYGSHHDRPRFQLAQNCGNTNNHKSDDQKRSTAKRGQSKKKSSISYLIESVDLLTKSGCVDTRDVAIWYTTTGWSSNYTLKHYAVHAYSVSQPRLRIQKQMPFVSASIRSSEQWCAPLK